MLIVVEHHMNHYLCSTTWGGEIAQLVRLGPLLCVRVRVSGKCMHSLLALVAPLMCSRQEVS